MRGKLVALLAGCMTGLLGMGMQAGAAESCLTEMTEFSKTDMTVSAGLADRDNYGNSYSEFLAPRQAYSSIEYLLNGEYDVLEGTIYTTFHFKEDNPKTPGVIGNYATVIVFADDVPIYAYTGCDVKMKPVPVSIPVSGVEFLKVVIEDATYTDTGSQSPALAFGDLVLKTTDFRMEPTPINIPFDLTNMEHFSRSGSIWVDCFLSDYDAFGNYYDSELSPLDSECYMEYLIDGQYELLTGTVYVTETTRDSDYTKNDQYYKEACVSIYADDVLLGSWTGFGMDAKPVDFAVRVQDAEFLRIEFSDGTLGDDPILSVGNLALWENAPGRNGADG